MGRWVGVFWFCYEPGPGGASCVPQHSAKQLLHAAACKRCEASRCVGPPAPSFVLCACRRSAFAGEGFAARPEREALHGAA